jgi:hypothetical protein
MADDYTDYVDTDSREPLGNSEGFIVMDSSADGFSYKKRVLRFAPNPGGIQQTLTGQWEVLIKDGPEGATLFHQIITFRVLCVFDGLGGVTFIPLDNGGKFETLVCDGQEVSKDAQGNYEGWRFVDTTTPTPFVEFAIPIFKPNSGGTLDGIFIDVDWQSPRYKIALSDGAVLRVEKDEWRQGTDIPIAYYQTSIKPGAPLVDAVIDPYGAMWHASTKDGLVRVATGFGPYRDLRQVGWISGAREASINHDPQGDLWLLVKEEDGWFEYSSANGGITWTKVRQVWDNTAKMARTLITENGTRISMALDGNDLIFKTDEEQGAAATRIATVEKRQPFTPAIDSKGNVYAVGEDGAEYSSVAGGVGEWSGEN